MICSVCKKNMAVVFINKLDKNGKSTNETTGFCIDCAKKQKIDPISSIMKEMTNISSEDLDNMASQFNNILSELSLSDDLDDDEKPNRNFPNIFGNLMSFNKSEDDDIETPNIDDSSNNNNNKKKIKKNKYLDVFGENLTKKARENNLDIVIGRKNELERLIQILNRRNKNNPALIGEPGVGKTAIVNALAIAIVNGNVPSKLIDKELYLIDMTSLVAGTQFRGQFEARIKGLIDECKSLGNIILAIDEVHNIVGGLEHDNSMSAANMLKPALANGSIQIIGATTLKEYRTYIEKDTALERRFQPIVIDEPTKKDCLEILKGIKKYYEEYHKVKLTDEILNQAITLSDKYIHDRFLPDKAIDLLDEACARVNLENIPLTHLEKLKKEINLIDKNKIIIEENLSKDTENTDTTLFEESAKLKEEKCKKEKELKTLEKKVKLKEVSFDNLAQVVELWTKIPVMRIKADESEKLLNLKENLSKKIIGQSNAIDKLSNAILRKRANIRNISYPPSFIFVGPTGVGKTALVKALAYELFDNENSIIKLDMSEYTESNSTSKLIGSPPGYVGYDEAGQLTEKVRRNPYSIILFDEIEKAHSSIYNILLQILDEGRLTDSQGKSVSFKHTVIILTSNLGTNFKNDSYGFANNLIEQNMLESKVQYSLKEYFSPEFLNRIDDIIIFKKLSKDNIIKIAELMLKDLQKETKKNNILFTYEKDVLDFIVKKGYNDKFGARPLRRAIQSNIEDLLSIEFIKGHLDNNILIKLAVVDDKIVIL